MVQELRLGPLLSPVPALCCCCCRMCAQVSQHARCRVRVEVSPLPGEVPSGAHKVSLMGIMVSHFPIRLTTGREGLERMEGQLAG